MKIQREFSRFASQYGKYNIIQDRVAQKLIDELKNKPMKILDLGCGSGTIASKIDWDYTKLSAVDFSSKMLELHPKGDKIECIEGNFSEDKLFEDLVKNSYDRVFSASALQWATNLDETLYQISQLNAPISLAIFTSKTFNTLLKTAGIDSPLRCADEVSYLISQYFHADVEIMTYELEFESIEEIFTYIKKSGVSGGRNALSYKQMKALMRDYPSKTLEFEVLFART